jgi:integrase
MDCKRAGPKSQGSSKSRPSKSLTLEQAQQLLLTAADSRLYAYVVLSVTTGLRTEELRALRWAEVDLDAGTVAVLPCRAGLWRHKDAEKPACALAATAGGEGTSRTAPAPSG